MDEDEREIQEMQARLLEIEAEAAKLAEEDGTGEEAPGEEAVDDAEDRQIYVGNLDESVTPDTLNEFFKECGTVNRITILCDKFTGKPKGFAYMEFEQKEAVELAIGLNETEMNGRQIKVTLKRKNVPRHMLGGRGRGRGRGRGGGYRGRGGGFRGRGRIRFNPY